MRKTRLWLLTIATLLGSLTASAHDFEVDGIYYNIIDSAELTVEVTFYGEQSGYSIPEEYRYKGDIVIPKTVSNAGKTYRVTAIGECAFTYCWEVTSITIPESITEIEGSLYFEMKLDVYVDNLESWCNINFTAPVGAGGFHNLYVKNKLQTEFIIPTSITEIKDYTFGGCRNIKSVKLHENITHIGRSAFQYCDSLVHVNIPTGINKISEYAFIGCGLSSIVIPEGVTLIENGAFEYCRNLESVTISQSVTTIGEYVFCGCSNLESVTIPQSVTSIGKSAFSGCSNLDSISLPNSLQEIPEEMFKGCKSLTTIQIPYGISTIGMRAFSDCDSLTTVKIPQNVTSIEPYCFQNCKSLKNVFFEDGNMALSIGYYNSGMAGTASSIFLDCPIETIYLGRNLSYPSVSPFSQKKGLTTVTVGKNVTSISGGAFNGCTGLKKLVFEDGEDVLSLGCMEYVSGKNAVGKGMFYDCPVKEIYLGRNITYSAGSNYGYSPFYNKNLTLVVVSKYVNKVEEYAFYGANVSRVLNYSSLVIDKGSMGYGYIGYNAEYVYNIHGTCGNFYFGLVDDVYRLIYYDGDSTNISLPLDYEGSSYEIDADVFKGYERITSIRIPESVKAIGNNAFQDCINLTKIVIGSYVDMFGDDAFAGCTNVKELTVLGSVMPYIPSEVFTSITLRSPVPLETREFANAVYRNCELHVPEGSIGRYQAADVWKNFWYIYGFDPTGIKDVTMSKNVDVPVYDMKGIRMKSTRECLPPGLYIQNGKKFVVM